MKSTIYLLTVLTSVCLVGLLGCHAPKDYYLEFAKMERLGEELRAEAPAEGPHRSEDAHLALAFEPGESPSDLLEFGMRAAEASTITPARIFRAQIPVAVDEDALKQTLEQRGITVTGVRNVDGRLREQYNVVRISFVPAAYSDEALYEAYLLLLAVVRGADTRDGTVDQVIGIAEDESANTRMILEGRIEDYIAYVEKRLLSQQEWLDHVNIRRF